MDKILAQIANNEAEVERKTKSNKEAEVERKTKPNKEAEFEKTKKALAEQLETLSQTFYHEMYVLFRNDVVPLNKELDEWSGHANFVSVVRWSEHPERYGNEIYAISSGLMVRVLDRLAEICRAKGSQTIAKQHFRNYSKENQRKVAQVLWIWITKNDPKITSKQRLSVRGLRGRSPEQAASVQTVYLQSRYFKFTCEIEKCSIFALLAENL